MKALLLLAAFLVAGCISPEEWCKDGNLYFTGAERDDTRSGCAIGPKGQCSIYFYTTHQWEMTCYLPSGEVKTDWFDSKPTDQRPPDTQ